MKQAKAVLMKLIGLFLINTRKLAYSVAISKLNGRYDSIPKPVLVSQIADAKPSLIEALYGKIKDKEAANRFGANNLLEFSHWAWRSCGIAALLSVIRAHRLGLDLKIMDLIKKGVSINGYEFKNDTGWKHKAIASLAKDYGIETKTIQFAPAELIAKHVSTGDVVLVSVISKTGSHLILITGVWMNNGQIAKFEIVDPNTYHNVSNSITIGDFRGLSTNRIIVFKGGVRNVREKKVFQDTWGWRRNTAPRNDG